MNDPIADMLTRIRNAVSVSKKEAAIPFSKLKFAVAKTLKEEGFITDFKRAGRGPKRQIIVELKYDNQNGPAIKGLKRISKPGQRIYVSVPEIQKVRGGFGIAIISTPRGLMTASEAKKENLGGELLCQVW